MKSEIEMTLVGELTYFLGLQVKQMEDNIFVSQSKYDKSIVKKFGLINGSHKRNPDATHLKLFRDESGVDVDQSIYRSMIGIFLYLATTRPDITFVVGVCVRYQTNPKMSYLTQVKRILKYISETYDYDILYSHDTNLILVGYCDAKWVGSADDKKSTSGGCFFLEKNPISWFNKKRNCVSLSIVEVEYIVAGSSCMKLL
ncbi:secreted RxLR effector protein 161-like [Lathyrus oleraceus]|uniref:secreted RxLR effector protein 161-like n=1 Tax=Pisum sativum TaxID=3888 RepID=UPI0021D22B6E|nr:secreted RxLR effector protein 161-like [Pisum sativum]